MISVKNCNNCKYMWECIDNNNPQTKKDVIGEGYCTDWEDKK